MLAECPGLDKNYRLIEFKTKYNHRHLAFTNNNWSWVLTPYSADCRCCMELTKDNNKPLIRMAYWVLLESAVTNNMDDDEISSSHRFHCCDHCLANMEFEGVTMHKIALAKKLKGVP